MPIHTMYDLRGTLHPLDETLTTCGVAELVAHWQPLIRIFNGDWLSVSFVDILSGTACLQCGETYGAVIWPFTQAGLQEHYGKDFFAVFPKGERFDIGSPRKVHALFDVEGYIDRAAAGRWTPRLEAAS